MLSYMFKSVFVHRYRYELLLWTSRFFLALKYMAELITAICVVTRRVGIEITTIAFTVRHYSAAPR